MAIGVNPSAVSAGRAVLKRSGASSGESIFRAPLVPLALAATAGIVLDRYASIPLLISLLVTVAGIVAWAIALYGGTHELGVAYLGISAAALGAGYHHGYRNVYRADDIGEFVAVA